MWRPECRACLGNTNPHLSYLLNRGTPACSARMEAGDSSIPPTHRDTHDKLLQTKNTLASSVNKPGPTKTLPHQLLSPSLTPSSTPPFPILVPVFITLPFSQQPPVHSHRKHLPAYEKPERQVFILLDNRVMRPCSYHSGDKVYFIVVIFSKEKYVCGKWFCISCYCKVDLPHITGWSLLLRSFIETDNEMYFIPKMARFSELPQWSMLSICMYWLAIHQRQYKRNRLP